MEANKRTDFPYQNDKDIPFIIEFINASAKMNGLKCDRTGVLLPQLKSTPEGIQDKHDGQDRRSILFSEREQNLIARSITCQIVSSWSPRPELRSKADSSNTRLKRFTECETLFGTFSRFSQKNGSTNARLNLPGLGGKFFFIFFRDMFFDD